MNVTGANAATVLEEWQALVDRCEFYAVDQEMTGIDGDGPLNKDGPLSEIYANVSTAVKRYSAFQYGICLFERKDKTTASDKKTLGNASDYIVRPFSFWLLNDNADITLSTSAVKFLLSNSMDYQFWLGNGFEYGPTDLNACPNYEDFTEEEKAWVSKHFEAINQWYDNPPPPPPAPEAAETEVVAQTTATVSADEPPAKVATVEKVKYPEDEYLLETYVSARADLYLHYLLYAQTSHIPEGYEVPAHIKATAGRQTPFNATPTKSLANGRPPRFCRVWFHRIDPTAEQVWRRTPLEDRVVKAKPTFHPFFKALVESKKPHVGHNYFTDLMFQIHQHHTPLPADYSVYRSMLADMFPQLYDTKVLSEICAKPPKNSSLGFVFAEFAERARKAGIAKKYKFPLGFNDLTRKDRQCAHDGAYDAFMTGVVFLYVLSTSPAVNSVNVGKPIEAAPTAEDGAAAPEAEGIVEGYLTYEGVIAQFGSAFWLALRRDDDLPRGVDARNAIMGIPTPVAEDAPAPSA